MADEKRSCDLQLVSDSFISCLKDGRDVVIDHFLVGYDELCRCDNTFLSNFRIDFDKLIVRCRNI